MVDSKVILRADWMVDGLVVMKDVRLVDWMVELRGGWLVA